MKISYLIISLIAASLLPLHLYSQNEEQKAWLNQQASERNNIILSDSQKVIPHSSLKGAYPDEHDWEVDHGDNQEASGTYSSSGGAYRTTQNATAVCIIDAKNIGINLPSSLTLTGKGINMLLLDSKRPRNKHEAFNQRVFVPEQDLIGQSLKTGKDTIIINGIPTRNLHPTLVSGTMASNSLSEPNAIGAAPGAEIIAYDWNFTRYYLAEYAAQGINIACVPWGYLAGWANLEGTWYWFGEQGQSESYLFGFYSNISQEWDDLLCHAPYLLVVKSAGNDNNEGPTSSTSFQEWYGGTSGWKKCDGCTLPLLDGHNLNGNNNTDCISDIAVSKNVLTIGAVNDDSTILDCSGRGPTDDLRIKPDLVANGYKLYSTTDADIDTYGDEAATGTSFAAASVAGGIALLLEQQAKLYGKTKLLSSTLKALLIHTAEHKGSVGPDITYGWGIPNIAAAAKVIEDNYQNHRQIHEFAFSSDSQVVMFSVKKELNKPLKVTICWTDPAGTPPGITIDTTNKMLVNDIDLRVIRKSDNYESKPWILDSSGQSTTGDNITDNVEQVVVNDNLTCDYYVKIYPKPKRLSQKQVVSVIITGNDKATLQNDIILNDTIFKDTRVYEAKKSITSTNVSVESGGKLLLIAKNNVLLKTGFKVHAGAMFWGIRDTDFYSAFERVYPSVIFQNNLVWVNRDANPKSSKAFENTNDTVNVLKESNQVSVYPNPSNGKFTLMLIDPANTQSIEIFNVLGRVCYRKNCCFQSHENVDITKYPDGLYLVKVQADNKTYIIKQIKKQQ